MSHWVFCSFAPPPSSSAWPIVPHKPANCVHHVYFSNILFEALAHLKENLLLLLNGMNSNTTTGYFREQKKQQQHLKAMLSFF